MKWVLDPEATTIDEPLWSKFHLDMASGDIEPSGTQKHSGPGDQVQRFFPLWQERDARFDGWVDLSFFVCTASKSILMPDPSQACKTIQGLQISSKPWRGSQSTWYNGEGDRPSKPRGSVNTPSFPEYVKICICKHWAKRMCECVQQRGLQRKEMQEQSWAEAIGGSKFLKWDPPRWFETIAQLWIYGHVTFPLVLVFQVILQVIHGKHLEVFAWSPSVFWTINWATKKNPYYFPWNPGWLIGIPGFLSWDIIIHITKDSIIPYRT